jgi:hypothetical protein
MPNLLTPTVEAVLALLQADTALQAQLGNPARIFDHRPAMATFPYLVLDGLDGREAGAKNLLGQNLVLTLRVLSRQRSGTECRTLLALVRDCLHDASLSISGASLARCQEENVLVTFDPDSGGSQGLARYRLVVAV